MLSPGKYHLLIPRDPLENLRLRAELLKRANTDPIIRAGLWEMCRQDILFFIDLFIIQINPDTMEKGPFITWPYQEVALIGGETEIGGEKVFQDGLLACVVDRKDVRWPKSRDGGASWVVLMAIVWLCIFHENIAAGAISRDEDSVDKLGDPNSLFQKVRVMLEHMPDWMKGVVKDKKGSFVFANGNTFNGEANVASANVGGRLTILLVDEFGQFDKNGEWIYDFTRDVCKCRVFVFTHKDQIGMAYKLCYDAKFSEVREIMTHWSQHPRKNRGLYRSYLDDEGTGRVEVLDKQFDFAAICAHNVPKSQTCSICRKFGQKEFDFDLTGKPVGGPCQGIRSPWYDEECRARNERDVAMNLDINPRGASDLFFDAYRISLLKASHCVRPVWRGNLEYDKITGVAKRLVADSDGLIKMWVNPKSEIEMPRIRAGAAVDVSAGSGYSPSCLSVFDARTGTKVLEYANANIYAPDFATFCFALLTMIRDEHGSRPLLAWEIQGSAAFQRRLIDELHYTPGYIKREEDITGKPRDNKGRYGFNPTPKSILTLMEQYRDGLYQQRCINLSEDALDETLRFVYTTNSVEYRARGKKHEDGSGATIHHGDMVRSDALAYKMIKDRGFESPQKEIKKKEWLDPRTFEGRTKLAELKMREREEEEWA